MSPAVTKKPNVAAAESDHLTSLQKFYEAVKPACFCAIIIIITRRSTRYHNATGVTRAHSHAVSLFVYFLLHLRSFFWVFLADQFYSC